MTEGWPLMLSFILFRESWLAMIIMAQSRVVDSLEPIRRIQPLPGESIGLQPSKFAIPGNLFHSGVITDPASR